VIPCHHWNCVLNFGLATCVREKKVHETGAFGADGVKRITKINVKILRSKKLEK